MVVPVTSVLEMDVAVIKRSGLKWTPVLRGCSEAHLPSPQLHPEVVLVNDSHRSTRAAGVLVQKRATALFQYPGEPGIAGRALFNATKLDPKGRVLGP